MNPASAHEAPNTASMICLVGMPGAGKSTVGRELAKRLAWQFADTDAAIEKRCGCSIPTFFETHGEAPFRDLEASVVEELTLSKDTVLATGGGVVLRPENRRHLRARSQVVYLRSSPMELHRRLRNDRSRPLLQGTDMRMRLQSLFEQRDPLYRETAHFVIDTHRSSFESLVKLVLMQLELAGVVDPNRAPGLSVRAQ